MKFRLSYDWIGPDFTFLIINGILRGTTVSGIIERGTPLRIGTRSELCSHQPQSVGIGSVQRSHAIICRQRHFAYQRAVDLVERNSFETVKSGILNSTRFYASPPGIPGLVQDGLRVRLQRIFLDRIREISERDRLTRIIDSLLGTLPESMQSALINRNDEQADHIDWAAWVNLHRELLTLLRPEFGLPGAIYTQNISAENDHA
jgi:hypothetical protein